MLYLFNGCKIFRTAEAVLPSLHRVQGLHGLQAQDAMLARRLLLWIPGKHVLDGWRYCGGSVGTHTGVNKTRNTCKGESYLFGRASPGLNGLGRPFTTALHGGGGGSGGVGTALPSSCRPAPQQTLASNLSNIRGAENRSPVPIPNLGGLTASYVTPQANVGPRKLSVPGSYTAASVLAMSQATG